MMEVLHDMLKIKSKGNWDRTDNFFKKSIRAIKIENITFVADKCIERLKAETPKDSGLTADSWGYEIEVTKNRSTIHIYNRNVIDDTKVVFLLEFGHATPSGSWVEGQNFIKPIMRKVYNDILNETRKELNRL